MDDTGLNDCSILETRPDNEFGYGKANPWYSSISGAIDSTLNVSMDLDTQSKLGTNPEFLAPQLERYRVGYVEVKVGGGEWQQAADLSSNNDWSSWNVKLTPHSGPGIQQYIGGS